jgi:hypothetical protein
MTEGEWGNSSDPQAMLRYLENSFRGLTLTPLESSRAWDRKLRLWCCAIARAGIWEILGNRPDLGNQEVIQWVEDNDGAMPDERMGEGSTWRGALRGGLWRDMCFSSCGDNCLEQADLLRHIVGNPWRQWVVAERKCAGVLKEYCVFDLGCLSTAIVGLAEAIHWGSDCAFALRDALLEVGEEKLADHFIVERHPRGCWAIDLLTGRS